MLRLFNYPGCKIKYTKFINPLINRTDAKIYVEPFCGTASILLNLEKSFDKNIINDFSREVITIIQTFRDCTYYDLVTMYDNIHAEFGSIKEKANYYKFRNEYNLRYFGKGTMGEGLFLYIVSRAAINSLFRIGPNGFNQSFGNRGNKLSMAEEEFEIIKEILKSSIIYHKDYSEIINLYDGKDTLFFLDPPYVERKIQGSYKDEKNFDKNKFLEIIKNVLGKVIYTDVFSLDLAKELNWNYKIITNKSTVDPNSKRTQTDYQEAIYFNYE